VNKRKGQVLFRLIVSRKALLERIRFIDICPYTGTLDRGTIEYSAIYEFFDRRFGIKKILSNEKEIENVKLQNSAIIAGKNNIPMILGEKNE
jgi:hypothetical protein